MKKTLGTVGAIIVATSLTFGTVAPVSAASTKSHTTVTVKGGEKTYTYKNTSGEKKSFTINKNKKLSKAEIRRAIVRAFIKKYYSR